MLVAYRLAGLSALEAHYAGRVTLMQAGAMTRREWQRSAGTPGGVKGVAALARSPAATSPPPIRLRSGTWLRADR
jgi:hypothetical protein